MELGFETIGNATLTCHDTRPVLVTDPWLVGPAYFGSWGRAHDIPGEQMEAIRRCQYVWLSHGHPDHLSADSLKLLADKTILLPDHHGGRIRDGLVADGFSVTVLRDRAWSQLSPRIRIACIADYNQDAILLVDVGGVLLINTNDASDRGWGRFVRRLAKNYTTSFLLALSGYGDADMINFFDEDGRRILPPAAKKVPPGPAIARRTEMLGAKFFVPFSSMHKYQRTDSIWANEYITRLSDYQRGFDSRSVEILPGYIRYDCLKQAVEEIRPPETPAEVFAPGVFGDDWSEPLEEADVVELRTYFAAIRHLERVLGYLRFRVGGREYVIDIARDRRERGITFEVPRHSLMSAIRWQVFDDLLIGNFMKTTLHGTFGDEGLYPDFSPYVAKFADNGQARTPDEVRAYFAAYRRRAPVEFLRHRLERGAVRASERIAGALFRTYVPRDSMLYRWTKRAYWNIRARL